VLQLSDIFYWEFWLSYGQLNASLQNEKKTLIRNFKHKTKWAGKDWAQDLRRRNRELGVTKPKPTRVIGILAFKKIEVTRIYDNLVTVLGMCKFGLNHTFSVDESGFSFVQKPPSVIQLSKTGWDYYKFWAKMNQLVVEVPLEVSAYTQNQGGWSKVCSSSGSRLSSPMFSLLFGTTQFSLWTTTKVMRQFEITTSARIMAECSH
jgi:hypothetical protein